MIQVVSPQRREAREPEKREHFSGSVQLHYLVRPEQPGGVELIGVYFPAGARTIPHVHSTDQALYILEGEGIVATEHDRRTVRPGEIAVIPAGTWHWHGATPTSAMAHLSVRPAGPTDWTVDRRDWDRY
jgi:quercetin dioxygenase-like cupin family protein